MTATEPAAKSPPISTPGPAAAPELVTETPPAAAGRPSGCEPHRPQIEAKLERGSSAQRIYQDLVTEVGFAGSYQSVKRFVRQRRQQHPERVWRLEVQPGEEVQVDFGTGAPVVTADGQRRRPWVLRVALSFSRKAYSEAVFHQATENFIRCLENAFRAFGGVAQVVNLDNLRAAVHKADWCDPELNPKLLSFCRQRVMNYNLHVIGHGLLPCASAGHRWRWRPQGARCEIGSPVGHGPYRRLRRIVVVLSVPAQSTAFFASLPPSAPHANPTSARFRADTTEHVRTGSASALWSADASPSTSGRQP